MPFESQNREQIDTKKIFFKLARHLHPDTFVGPDKLKAQELMKSINAIKSAQNGDATKPLSSQSKSYANDFFVKLDKIQLDEPDNLSQIQTLINLYSDPILKNTTLKQEHDKKWENTQQLDAILYSWLTKCGDNEAKPLINHLNQIIKTLKKFQALEYLTPTENTNINNILPNAGTHLRSELQRIASGTKTDSQIAVDFLTQLLPKLERTLHSSKQPKVIELHNSIKKLSQLFIKNDNYKESTQAKYEYKGYNAASFFNSTNNGILTKLYQGTMTYSRTINGKIVFISREEAEVNGAPKIKINSDGSINIEGSIVGGIVTNSNHYKGVNTESAPNENQTIPINGHKTLEKLNAGTTNLQGQGTVTIEKLNGGILNIGPNLRVVIEKINGGVVNIDPKSFLKVDKINGGVIKGKDRLQYGKNNGGTIY
jgi:hypothetical protein